MRISDWSSDVCSSDLLSFPKPPEGSNVSPVDYSIAGRIAGGLNTVLEPIGFNRDISLALVPAMAAREVAVSALATVYSIEQSDDEAKTEQSLSRSEEHQSDSVTNAPLVCRPLLGKKKKTMNTTG